MAGRGASVAAPAAQILHGAAPLKPLPEPADLGHYRVRKRARAGGLINEYHLVT